MSATTQPILTSSIVTTDRTDFRRAGPIGLFHEITALRGRNMTIAHSEGRSSAARNLPGRLASVPMPRSRAPAFGVDRPTKQANASLIGSTVQTGIMVAVALILILVLLPAALAAQTAGLH